VCVELRMNHSPCAVETRNPVVNQYFPHDRLLASHGWLPLAGNDLPLARPAHMEHEAHGMRQKTRTRPYWTLARVARSNNAETKPCVGVLLVLGPPDDLKKSESGSAGSGTHHCL